MSPRLIEDKSYQWLLRPTPQLYIPLEIPCDQDWREAEWKERLVVGHSVGFDRSFIKEQYYIKVQLFVRGFSIGLTSSRCKLYFNFVFFLSIKIMYIDIFS